MYVHRAYQVSVSSETTRVAVPLPVSRLVFMPTVGTPARCSSFRAGEARNMGLLCFVGQIVDVLAIFPQGHALIVVSALLLVADPMRIANVECANLVFDAEIDHFTRSFVSQITNTAFCPTALLVPGTLQLLPATRIPFATRLFLCDLAELLASLMLERTNPAPGHNHRLARVGGDSCQVNLSEINGGMNIPRSLFAPLDLETDMQLEPMVPHQRAGSAVLGKLNGQNQGRMPPAHRQDHMSLFTTHRLGRPLDWVETLLSPGILHLHLGMALAKGACGEGSGKERLNHHLHRLAMQGELSLRYFLQGISSGPGSV
jgi:hypothetical protein